MQEDEELVTTGKKQQQLWVKYVIRKPFSATQRWFWKTGGKCKTDRGDSLTVSCNMQVVSEVGGGWYSKRRGHTEGRDLVPGPENPSQKQMKAILGNKTGLQSQRLWSRLGITQLTKR